MELADKVVDLLVGRICMSTIARFILKKSVAGAHKVLKAAIGHLLKLDLNGGADYMRCKN